MGFDTFYGCTQLTSVTITALVNYTKIFKLYYDYDYCCLIQRNAPGGCRLSGAILSIQTLL